MSMQSFPRIAAAGLAALLLAGCGGSFVPATVGQNGGGSQAAARAVRGTDLQIPGSITPHPTAVGKSTPVPTGANSTDSITPHPTFPKDSDGKATPAPTAAPKVLVRTIDSVTAHPAKAAGMDNGVPSPTPSP